MTEVSVETCLVISKVLSFSLNLMCINKSAVRVFLCSLFFFHIVHVFIILQIRCCILRAIRVDSQSSISLEYVRVILQCAIQLVFQLEFNSIEMLTISAIGIALLFKTSGTNRYISFFGCNT